VVDWRVGDQERRTVEYAVDRFAAEAARLGLPIPVLAPMFSDPEVPFFMYDVSHLTGTTRMSVLPRDGVVNVNCTVHGVDNLHIAGSSVFPTSGHANPTQMIVALAVRLADHLKDALRG
jgi:choline dehydrogenase-like flavoprotein